MRSNVLLKSWQSIKVCTSCVMVHEKKPTKEALPLKELRKCKAHAFKDAYDQVRKRKLDLAGVAGTNTSRS